MVQSAAASFTAWLKVTVILSEEDRPLADDPDEPKDPYERTVADGVGILLGAHDNGRQRPFHAAQDDIQILISNPSAAARTFG